MNLIPWRGKTEGKSNGGSISRLRSDMDQLFEQMIRDPFGALGGWSGGWPTLDLCEGDQAVTVTAELPGVDPKDVDIDVTGDTLTLRGEKRQEHQEKQPNYHFAERSFGRFQRSIRLPVPVDTDKVQAVCRNGMLTITLPKREDVQRKRIEVKDG